MLRHDRIATFLLPTPPFVYKVMVTRRGKLFYCVYIFDQTHTHKTQQATTLSPVDAHIIWLKTRRAQSNQQGWGSGEIS